MHQELGDSIEYDWGLSCHFAPQVKIWRRSFDVPPPVMEPDNEYFKVIQEDPRYADVPKEELPTCESLELTIKRTLPFWNDVVVPDLLAEKKVGRHTSLRILLRVHLLFTFHYNLSPNSLTSPDPAR